MSVSSLLQRLNNKGKVQQTLLALPKPSASPSPSPRPAAVASGPRPVDPVVAQLKEKRRLEREKAEAQARAKKGLPEKKPKLALARSTGGSSHKPSGASGRKPAAKPKPALPDPPVRAARPKLSFDELMNKAKKIDTTTLGISLKQRTPEGGSKEQPPRKLKPLERMAAKARAQPDRPVRLERPEPRRPQMGSKRPPLGRPAPKPVARQPSQAVQQRLQQRKKSHDDDEDDEEEEDDFVVDDDSMDEGVEEGEEGGAEYDRDEIWAMFNRGRKRLYYTRYDDYDSDDMEATGAEVLEEETRSRRRAMAEDQRELLEEQRQAEEKRRRKLQRR